MKGIKMKKQANFALFIVTIVAILLIVSGLSFSDEPNVAPSNTQKVNQQNDLAFRYFIAPGIVGLIVSLVVLVVQILINPMIARLVKIQESILEQRYKACESAVDILQRGLASAKFTGRSVPGWYKPPEKPPTQLEVNVAYTQLAIFGKSQTIAEEFFAATGPESIKLEDIVKFVSAVRKEFGVDKKGFIGEFHYRMLRPVGENDQKNK